ncbi:MULTISPECIES: hypothetical protein [Silvimonas]|uniref:hypothetical protein n=1 Tax=Silvimonas TaxID=300264 RepID=UPI0024B36A2E|nr:MULTISPECIES: hypothetical protein [Silvimonas]MDR3427306.1 hypothetical protein [Silvimonas sp.]
MANTAPVTPTAPTVVAAPILAASLRAPLASEHVAPTGSGTAGDTRQAEGERGQARASRDDSGVEADGHSQRRQQEHPSRSPHADDIPQEPKPMAVLPGAPRYQLTVEPDGMRSVVFGRRKIDLLRGRTPEETLRKARIIMAATLGPATPSPEELSVAAEAQAMEDEAMNKIAARHTLAERQVSAYQPDLPASSAFEELA